jgi:hypothetical protein
MQPNSPLGEKNGERGRNRTFNLLIKSRLNFKTGFQTFSLSKQALATDQARAEAL